MDSAKIFFIGKPNLNIEGGCIINVQTQTSLYWCNSKKAFEFVGEH